ncbi:hypothetical protein FACS1894137_18130 [Spirochaetia bacterium]|nr:hypothetical protein FACS1894137_18130 [Spirochaetia bacterium]
MTKGSATTAIKGPNDPTPANSNNDVNKTAMVMGIKRRRSSGVNNEISFRNGPIS